MRKLSNDGFLNLTWGLKLNINGNNARQKVSIETPFVKKFNIKTNCPIKNNANMGLKVEIGNAEIFISNMSSLLKRDPIEIRSPLPSK